MTILVTGGTGAVGAEVIELLAGSLAGARIVAISRKDQEALPAGVTALRADLMDWRPSPSEAKTLFGDVTHIIHMAADIRWNQPVDQAMAANAETTANLIELSRRFATKLRRLVYVSTAFVDSYDHTDKAPKLAFGGGYYNNTYEYSKARGEGYVAQAQLPFCIVRPSLVIGSEENGQVSRFNGLYQVLRQIALGLAPAIVGEPTAVIDIVPVDVVSRAIRDAAFQEKLSGKILMCAGLDKSPELKAVLNITVSVLNDFRARHGVERLDVPPFVPLGTYERLYKPMMKEAMSDSLRRSVTQMEAFFPYLNRVTALKARSDAEIYDVPEYEKYYAKCVTAWCARNAKAALTPRRSWAARNAN
ncbi:nucleoside-diphosphate-sugar epimerase [Bradyrhizobium sp. AZCC 1678]|uniref:SDR family oxidoreductase n=1 Tax=Bradyrhizobium sp. AZCC 1678 TaxID=3117030 RepID=UPI002FF03F1D